MYKYNMGGSVPRETNIGGQRHSLAYINPFEEDLLQGYRGDMPTVPGPGGVPSYYYGQGMQTTSKEFQEGKTGTGKSSTFASSKPQKQSFKDSKEDKARARKNKEDKAKSDAVAAAADKAIADKLASGTYTKNTDGVLVATDPVVAASLARGYDKAPLDYDQAKALGADVGGNLFDPVTMTGYSDTAGQGLGTGFTLSGDKDDRGNVTGTTFTNAEDLITTGPKATGIMKVVEDVMGAPKSILDDLTMGYKAGLFSNRADQEANLLAAGYTREQIYDYFARTDATKQRMKDQAAANYANRGDDKDMTAAVIDDPCPEGYKLDPITNECVMDDTVDVLNPGGQQVTDFVMPSVNPVIGQAANYTGAVAPMNAPMPLQPYAPGTSGNLLQSSAPGLARTRAGGIMGL